MSIAPAIPASTVPDIPGALDTPSSPVPPDLFYRLSVDQYHAMIRLGILTADDPVELLEGWLVRKMPKGPLHSTATLKLRRGFDKILPDGYFANSQDSMTAGDSEPEPDVLIVRGTPDEFWDRHPGPDQILVLVEIASSSLSRDRTWKKTIYARVFIPEYWIVNLIDRRVEVHTDPTGPSETPDYRHRREFGPEEEVPVVVEGREVGRIAVREILP